MEIMSLREAKTAKRIEDYEKEKLRWSSEYRKTHPEYFVREKEQELRGRRDVPKMLKTEPIGTTHIPQEHYVCFKEFTGVLARLCSPFKH
jgi:hypothetical protein